MPIDLKKYPKNWNAIRREVRERAGNKCQVCGAPNRVAIWREKRTSRWTEDYEDARECFGPEIYRSVTKLGTAHLGVPRADGSPGDKYDTLDVRPENLMCMCVRCHLEFDRPEIVPRRRATLNRKARSRQEKAGQLTLWEIKK